MFGIVLSRLLLPEEFGLLAMVMVFSRFGNIFSDMGLSRALIHKREISPYDTSTVFWATVILGFLLAGLMAALAPSIAWFYKQPELTALALVIALNFIFKFSQHHSPYFTGEGASVSFPVLYRCNSHCIIRTDCHWNGT